MTVLPSSKIRWLCAAIVGALLFWSLASGFSGRELRIENFQSEIIVSKDGSIDVTENIQAHFLGGPCNGLNRTIPGEYVTPRSLIYSLFLDLSQITDGNGS